MKIAALLAVLAATPLAAQAQAGAQPGSEPATLRGVVVDSVRGGFRATDVDGVRVSETNFLMPNEVAAIEVYSPTMTPSEFRGLYATCATVVIWTDWKLRRAQVRR